MWFVRSLTQTKRARADVTRAKRSAALNVADGMVREADGAECVRSLRATAEGVVKRKCGVKGLGRATAKGIYGASAE